MFNWNDSLTTTPTNNSTKTPIKHSDYPRTSTTYTWEGFHRGLKHRVNRALSPRFMGSGVLPGCPGEASHYRHSSGPSCSGASSEKLCDSHDLCLIIVTVKYRPGSHDLLWSCRLKHNKIYWLGTQSISHTTLSSLRWSCPVAAAPPPPLAGSAGPVVTLLVTTIRRRPVYG